MDNEVYRDLSHHEARDLVATMHRERCPEVFTEFRLPNATIADVLMFNQAGDIEIIEVKTSLKASLVAGALAKYGSYCHRLWVAIPHLITSHCEESEEVLAWRGANIRVGIVGVYRDSLCEIRRATRQHVSPQLYRLVQAQRPQP